MVASSAATLYRVVTVERAEFTLVAIDDGVGGDVLVEGVRLAASRVGDPPGRAGAGRVLLHDGKQLRR